jgi:hypothetical protein
VFCVKIRLNIEAFGASHSYDLLNFNILKSEILHSEFKEGGTVLPAKV